jgi:putative SOS response-associated peptidase YedK
MPVIIPARDREDWLSADTGMGELKALLKPAPDSDLEYFPVSSLVNSPANDSPECIQPV